MASSFCRRCLFGMVINQRLCVSISQRLCCAIAASVSLVILVLLDTQHSATAQVIPDGTLSTTTTTSDNLNYLIEDGHSSGTTLFHSFDKFSIPTNGSAVFNNSVDVETIVSRVTGNRRSDLDGLIQANGTAHLFLLNPNGILFGPNASLDIGGSFLATTADRILFENNRFFSATDTSQPPTLRVSTPIGLQFGATQESITVQGDINTLAFGDVDFSAVQDEDGMDFEGDTRQTIALVGGNIQFEGGRLATHQGRIELGSVQQAGVVSIMSAIEGFTTSYESINRFGAIDFKQGSVIDVSGEGSGHINIHTGTLSLRENSTIFSDVFGTEDGGNIVIRATESLRLRDGASIDAFTLGEGEGGNIFITTNTLDIRGSVEDSGFPTGLFVNTNASGAAGDLVIETQRLTLTNGASIQADTGGTGDGGNIYIQATEWIDVSGSSLETSDRLSVISSDSVYGGQAGKVVIETDRLRLTNGGMIASAAFDVGNGGTISIQANTLDIWGSLSGLQAITTSVGDGGNIGVDVDHLRIRDGGTVSASTWGMGKGGNVRIQAQTVELRNTRLNGADALAALDAIDAGDFIYPGDAAIISDSEGAGQAGNVEIEADTIQLVNGGVIASAAFDAGNGGILRIQADTLAISGRSTVGQASGLFVTTLESGDGGNISVDVNHLNIMDGGIIGAATFGDGGAGSILLDIKTLTLTGMSEALGDIPPIPSLISSLSRTDAAAGTIIITGDRLTIQNGAEVIVSSLGTGNAGNLFVDANIVQLDNQGRLLAEANGGEEGNIRLRANHLLTLGQGSSITATATGPSTGGNIEIRSPFVVASPAQNSDIIANAVEGDGGSITIDTQGLLGLQFRDRLSPNNDITASSRFGIDGTVEINRPDGDPSAQVLELPDAFVNASQLVTSGCSVGEDQFVLLGRGGLSASPMDWTAGDRPWIDLRSPFVQSNSVITDTSTPLSPSLHPSPQPVSIQEATGMAIAPNGSLQLIAARPQEAITPPYSCTSHSNRHSHQS